MVAGRRVIFIFRDEMIDRQAGRKAGRHTDRREDRKRDGQRTDMQAVKTGRNTYMMTDRKVYKAGRYVHMQEGK